MEYGMQYLYIIPTVCPIFFNVTQSVVVSVVVYIFEKGHRNNAANYRPVSLTSIFCKVCEHIITKSIMQHLEDHGLWTDSKYGFRAKCFCKTQLLTLVDELLQGVATGKECDIVIMDFSKCFIIMVPQRHFPMTGLDQRLPDEQIIKCSSSWWILWRSSCHIWSATAQCTGTNPHPGFHQQLQMSAFCRWLHDIQWGEIQCWLWSTPSRPR